MLDLKFIRENAGLIREKHHQRGTEFDIEGLLKLDAERRRLVVDIEQWRREKKSLSQQVHETRTGEGTDDKAPDLVAKSREISTALKESEDRLQAIEQELNNLLLLIPNLPHASVPTGQSPDENVEVRRWGTARTFDFEPRPHWEIGEDLGILDLARAARMAGTRFPLLKGDGALLERALINFMLDLHVREHGYTEVFPPLLVSEESMVGTGQLPKFAPELFKMADDPYYLIPTAEVSVTNIHREEILGPGALPLCYVAFTPCFRREAGSYGKDTRGIIRQHQFNKVELVKFTEPARSYETLEQLTTDAEEVLKRLELPYRVVALCTGDLGFAAAKTYDLEVWFPSQAVYREVSSCSNFEDFQARRAGIRYRPAPGAKVGFVHTLNGSGLAIGRTWAAILENYQQADGSVAIPEVLRVYMRGLTKIEPH
ncbi:MAG: serine--tRNA ligase [candidate division NC10 bacterium]|jgi:seryl-tRNA synthetase|nr:serine--tRNA ligase [candidate division NC10 bacterium]MCH7895346.1 serine--tRNA ligase [candidate division NC10 bacterium]MCZ6552015.1 serine--tRNA ligase [candidate division NC10 bacterium]